jgi:mono/diheme cytochrome c family protein
MSGPGYLGLSTPPKVPRRRGCLLEWALALLAVAVVGVLLGRELLGGVTFLSQFGLIWPFALRPSLAAWAEPRLQQEIIVGAAMMAVALILTVVAWRGRRLRWLFPVAILTAYLAAPHLDLLLVPATPTSFHESPTGFTAQSVVQGAVIYGRHCRSCHGAEGRGDGPDASKQSVPPADLTAEHLWDHPDGDLFWWVSHGMLGVDGRQVMPGFADKLSDIERWAVIDFLHANAAAAELARTGRWPHEFLAPDMTATCADGSRVTLTSLRGKPIHIVVEGSDGAAEGGTSPTFVIGDKTRHIGCIVGDAEPRQALAMILGLPPDGIAGSQFLVSPDGWLLAHWHQGSAPAQDTLSFVAETLRSVCLSTKGPRHFGHR